jgi:hypothetical protein
VTRQYLLKGRDKVVFGFGVIVESLFARVIEGAWVGFETLILQLPVNKGADKTDDIAWGDGRLLDFFHSMLAMSICDEVSGYAFAETPSLAYLVSVAFPIGSPISPVTGAADVVEVFHVS